MRLITVLTATALLALVGASEASACSCAGPQPGQSAGEWVRESVRNADGAMTAKLLKVKRSKSQNAFASGTFTFRVLRAYKHRKRFEQGKRIRVRAPVDTGANCGLPPIKGFRTGILLYRENGKLTSNSCSLVTPKLMRHAMRGKDGSSRAALSSACERAGRLAAERA